MSAPGWVHFAASGVDTWLWLPPLAAFVLAFFSAMVGVSGAFLLLPFQMSVLGFTGPAVSATNLLYNLFATPGGIWRYAREGRLYLPLAAVIAGGALPGVLLGWWLRVTWLPDPARFRPFAAAVLALLAWRLLRAAPAAAAGDDWRLTPLPARAGRLRFRFRGVAHGFRPLPLATLSLAVGVVGGAYGIGGGALVAPLCIGLLRLPVHVVAGAALTGTFVTSLAGVAAYALLPAPGGGHAAPDWALGALFGVGGLAGMYLGAACQRHVPQGWLRHGLAVLLAALAAHYAWPALAMLAP